MSAASWPVQTALVTRRWVVDTVRVPWGLGVTVVQPLLWIVLFGNVFRSVTQVPGFGHDSYLTFLVPGILMMTMLYSGAWAGTGFVDSAGAVTYSNNRIAVTTDGNYNDKDDWGATPIGLALLAKRGLQAKLVHYDWANIFGPNDPTYYDQMKNSTFDRSKFFDCRNDLDGAINGLRTEIDASTALDPLFIIATGHDQGPGVRDLFQQAGATRAEIHKDFGGRDRAVKGWKKPLGIPGDSR